MRDVVNVAVHSSVFPEKVQRNLLQCLRSRRVDPKFHYATYKQARKWLALHDAFSPSRTEASCAAAYERSFDAALKELKGRDLQVISLGCGGGQKEARFLTKCAGQGGGIAYTPSDISLALVLTALAAAQSAIPGLQCDPLVCDFGNIAALSKLFPDREGIRLYTFFGMIPNFEPEIIMPGLAGLVRPRDLLLFSANLAPGSDYSAGVQRVLPGYDNPLTRDWLFAFLEDVGVAIDDGSILFSVEAGAAGLKRIVADYEFSRRRVISAHGEQFKFLPGEKIRLFFSYRYTPLQIEELLAEHKLSIIEEFLADSGEEGVFLCRRMG